MKHFKKLMLMFVCIMAFGSMTACGTEKDKTVDDTTVGDTLKEDTKDIVDDAGDVIEDGADAVKDGVDDLTDTKNNTVNDDEKK